MILYASQLVIETNHYIKLFFYLMLYVAYNEGNNLRMGMGGVGVGVGGGGRCVGVEVAVCACVCVCGGGGGGGLE